MLELRYGVECGYGIEYRIGYEIGQETEGYPEGFNRFTVPNPSQPWLRGCRRTVCPW